jgi:hypothetical protein
VNTSTRDRTAVIQGGKQEENEGAMSSQTDEEANKLSDLFGHRHFELKSDICCSRCVAIDQDTSMFRTSRVREVYR